MKKYLVILGALLMVAGSAFGQGTILNQDSCDISVSPAATLLLPYFSVNPAGETTLVTITNVSDSPAVAHFTVWTNLSYPVLDFNIFLTGYDVQGISLTDVLVNGVVPNTGTPTALSPRGTRSLPNQTGNVNSQGGNFGLTCDGAAGQGGNIPPGLLSNVQSALTGGGYFDCGTGEVSLATDTMVGYITIDVIDICSQDLPTVGDNYFDLQMLHDNQLIGDYIRIDGVGGVAGASPLVHIKSVPFGGPAPATVPVVTGFPRTFYDRYQRDENLNDPAIVENWFDRRQPLPAQFAARYIEPGGSTGFNTNFAIWRQGITNADDSAACDLPNLNLTTYVEIVRFDERENPTTRVGGTCQFSPCDPLTFDELPETSLVPITSTIIPADSSSADRGGWLYLNLANSAADVVTNYGPTQAWVQVRMTAAGTFGVDFDAAYLANGCSSFRGVTALGGATGGAQPKIGPHLP